MSRSDGSTADYYVLPEAATQLQDLISHRDMNSQIGEIFRACYRYGIVSHSDKMRDAKKIRFYAQAEVERLEKLAKQEEPSHIISDIPSAETPDWNKAPEWANWMAQNADGWWEFYEDKPTVKCGNEHWSHELKGCSTPVRTNRNGDWRNTLHPRPTSTAK